MRNKTSLMPSGAPSKQNAFHGSALLATELFLSFQQCMLEVMSLTLDMLVGESCSGHLCLIYASENDLLTVIVKMQVF